MGEFPILQRTRRDLAARLRAMKPQDPRRGEVARALRDATHRLMRAQVELTARARRAPKPRPGADAAPDGILALIARGPAAPVLTSARP